MVTVFFGKQSVYEELFMQKNSDKQPVALKERDNWFDNAKAILIAIVVIGHMAEALIVSASWTDGTPKWLDALYKSIYVFHMPVFMAISGRFARGRIDRNDWIGVINKLIAPYVVVQTVMMVFYSFTGYGSVSNFSYMSPLFGIWYIITIAVYQLITPHLKKIKGLFLISLVVAVVIQFGHAVPKGGFMRLFTYYPFFLFGYYFFQGDKLNFCKKIWFRVISVVAFIVLFGVVITESHYFKVGALTLKRVFTNIQDFYPYITELKFLVYTLLHYAVGFVFFFFLMGIAPTKKKFFSNIGKYSTYIYLLHLFFIVFVNAMDKRYGILDNVNTDIRAIIWLCLSIPMCFALVSRPVRRLTSWMVSPDFDLKRLVSQLKEKDEANDN